MAWLSLAKRITHSIFGCERWLVYFFSRFFLSFFLFYVILRFDFIRRQRKPSLWPMRRKRNNMHILYRCLCKHTQTKNPKQKQRMKIEMEEIKKIIDLRRNAEERRKMRAHLNTNKKKTCKNQSVLICMPSHHISLSLSSSDGSIVQ